GFQDHLEARVAPHVDLAEVERAVGAAVEARRRRRRAIPQERVLDGQAHVRLGELRLYAAVDVLDERVHDALRVVDDVDALVVEAVEPARLDDLVALVHARGRVDGDRGSHLPGRVVKRVLRRDTGKRLERYIAERAPRRGERHAADLREILTDEALPESVVLAVDRAKSLPRPAGQTADEMARGDEDFLVREGDALAIFERGDGRAQRGDPGRRDEDEVRVGIGCQRDEGVRTERRARGRKLQSELAQFVDVAVRAERDDAQAIGLPTDDIEGLTADGTGGAEDRKTDRSGHQPIIPDRPGIAGVCSESLDDSALATQVDEAPHPNNKY